MEVIQIYTTLEKPWCWERLRAEGEEGVRRWDGWTASPMQWTWTWANSRRWWGTGRPGVLRLQRVGHDWAIEQQQPRKLCKWKLYKYIQHQSSRIHTSKPWDITSHPPWCLEWKRQMLASVDGERTLMHGWWEYKMVLPLWRTLCLSVS